MSAARIARNRGNDWRGRWNKRTRTLDRPFARPEKRWPNSHKDYDPAYDFLGDRNFVTEKRAEEALIKFADDNGLDYDELRRKVEQYLRDEIYDERMVSMLYPSDALTGLLASERFKTQFETGTSKGILDWQLRTYAENLGLGVPRDVDPRKRPKYGFLDLKDGKVSPRAQGMHYDLQLLKPEVYARP